VPTIAIGDIHGNREALDDLLARIRPELSGGDTVVFLGDYIDRGPDTKGCIDSILQLRADSPARVVTLIGNHEDWMLRSFEDPSRHSWLVGMEGLTTVLSYSAEAAEIISRAAQALGPRLVLDRVALPYDAFLRALPADHLAFFSALTLVHQADGALFSHGGLDPAVADITAQTRDALIWGSATWPVGCVGPNCHVYGHHNDAELDDTGWPNPARGPFSLGIDTISHGVLTAVRMPDRALFQSGRFAP
jgi:serine/threonine protein phosphatase 1